MEDHFKKYIHEFNLMAAKNKVYGIVTNYTTDEIIIPAIRIHGVYPTNKAETKYDVSNSELWRIHFPRNHIYSYSEGQGVYEIVVGRCIKITMRVYSDDEIEMIGNKS
jgi:hypothetical protein